MAIIEIQTGDDTFISDSSPSSNFGDLAGLIIGHDIAGKAENDYDYRILIRFDLTSLIGATINSATLLLTNVDGSVSQTISLYRASQPNWTELGATWGTYDGVTSWGGDHLAGGAFTSTNWTSGDLSFDAASIVADAITNRAGMLNCVLSSNALSDSATLTFNSFESLEPETAPKLTIDYTGGAQANNMDFWRDRNWMKWYANRYRLRWKYFPTN